MGLDVCVVDLVVSRLILPALPHPMQKLRGKRALVTAGAQGIGLAISRQLLAAGCDVFVHYHRSADAAKALNEEAAALGRRCGSASANLTTSEESHELVAKAVE